MPYAKHFKFRAPEINLPFSKPTLIFTYYSIDGQANDPRKTATCKTCRKEIEIIFGGHVNSSFTFGLTFHLKDHPSEWTDFLNELAKMIVPDVKSKYEHYMQMTTQTNLSKYVSQKRFDECIQNINMNDNFCNPAGIAYRYRDRLFLQNEMYKISEGQNAQMFEYIFEFTNRNVTLFDLMGTKHPHANLRTNYKKAKILIDDIGNLGLDLQKLLCNNICFFDPELYFDCPNTHTGDIAVFADESYQEYFPNLREELEKYPEFQNNKSFNHQILKDVAIVEHERAANIEMNRLLKIIISMLKTKRRQINIKKDQVKSRLVDRTNLTKPPLAVNMWGPKFSDIDVPNEIDEGKVYPEEQFSTFRHVQSEDCPGFKNQTDVKHEPVYNNGKMIYPCNIGGCGKGCECDPCTGKGPLHCPDHSIDHPLLFDPEDDLVISRRMFVDPKNNDIIFKRPLSHPKLSPPDLLLAGLKVKCKICKHNKRNHLQHHHSIHPGQVCDICNHKKFISKNSFKLICYICMKQCDSKYRLKDHMNIHDSKENPYFCRTCEKGFTSKFSYNRHILENHEDKVEEYNCSKCEAKFTLERNLERHMQAQHTNEDEKENVCNLCEKSYNRKDNLLKHQRIEHNKLHKKVILPGINDDVNPHQCYLCMKTFKQKYHLDRHQESVHYQNSNVVFKCNTCEKSFRRKDKLQNHEKTHFLGNPKIVCEICQKQFKTKDGLKAHRIAFHE